MVKKILKDGSPCSKCVQAEDILKKRSIWHRIDRIIEAVEGDAASEGNRLADELGVNFAPYFIVEEGGSRQVYTRVYEFVKILEATTPRGMEDAESSNLTNHVQTPSAASHLFDTTETRERYADMEPWEILADAQEVFGKGLAISFSGAEDVVLIDMAAKNGKLFAVFCLDTGRLYPETYDFLDRVRVHYGITLEVFMPSSELLEPFIREKGLNSFYRDGHSECCAVRKVEPLKRALEGRKAWVSGLRRDQNPLTRGGMAHVESDSRHNGENGVPLVKFNPLLEWSSQRVWEYIRENKVPYNTMHDRGYVSIGCAPCTRALRPGEHERQSRWWWEDSGDRECGLHGGGHI